METAAVIQMAFILNKDHQVVVDNVLNIVTIVIIQLHALNVQGSEFLN